MSLPPHNNEISFATCAASSRVGTSTKPVGRPGRLFVTFAAMAIPNARVLPEPVGAFPQISFPASASGNVAS